MHDLGAVAIDVHTDLSACDRGHHAAEAKLGAQGCIRRYNSHNANSSVAAEHSLGVKFAEATRPPLPSSAPLPPPSPPPPTDFTPIPSSWLAPPPRQVSFIPRPPRCKRIAAFGSRADTTIGSP